MSKRGKYRLKVITTKLVKGQLIPICKCGNDKVYLHNKVCTVCGADLSGLILC
jgi:hypothetical protein